MKSNRRTFFQTLGAGAAGLAVSPSLAITSCTNQKANKQNSDGQILFVGDDIAVAETTSGKVRGFILRDIYNFRGIPYGADTSAENRYMPPRKPEPWTDIRPAVW
jgi:para-nitrobenzyl esterase